MNGSEIAAVRKLRSHIVTVRTGYGPGLPLTISKTPMVRQKRYRKPTLYPLIQMTNGPTGGFFRNREQIAW